MLSRNGCDSGKRSLEVNRMKRFKRGRKFQEKGLLVKGGGRQRKRAEVLS